MAEILVTGGTGTLGRQIVQQFCYLGFDVGILSTREHVDLSSGAKIYAGDLTEVATIRNAVEDAAIIIHCASSPLNAGKVDVEGTQNLLQCIDRKRIRHFIYVSIAGVNQSRYPYYKAKYQVEEMIRSSDVPWSVLRATQFHDFILHRIVEPFDKRDGSPLQIPARMRFQSLDVRDVAIAVQELAMGNASKSIRTIGGPEILTIEEMARAYLALQHRDERVSPEEIPGELYDLFRSGINVSPEWAHGKITWENFLSDRLKEAFIKPAAGSPGIQKR